MAPTFWRWEIFRDDLEELNYLVDGGISFGIGNSFDSEFEKNLVNRSWIGHQFGCHVTYIAEYM